MMVVFFNKSYFFSLTKDEYNISPDKKIATLQRRNILLAFDQPLAKRYAMLFVVGSDLKMDKPKRGTPNCHNASQ